MSLGYPGTLFNKRMQGSSYFYMATPHDVNRRVACGKRRLQPQSAIGHRPEWRCACVSSVGGQPTTVPSLDKPLESLTQRTPDLYLQELYIYRERERGAQSTATPQLRWRRQEAIAAIDTQQYIQRPSNRTVCDTAKNRQVYTVSQNQHIHYQLPTFTLPVKDARL